MLVSEVVLVRVPSHTTRFLFAHQGWVRTILTRLIGKAFGGRPGPKGSGSFPSALVGSNSPGRWVGDLKKLRLDALDGPATDGSGGRVMLFNCKWARLDHGQGVAV